MGTMREASIKNWTSSDNTLEYINAGSWQRMADAMELMAKNHHDLQRERDDWEITYRATANINKRLEKSNAALRGHIKKLKRELNQAKQEALS